MRSQKLPVIALGLATLWPLLHVMVFAVSVALMATGPGPTVLGDFFPILMASHVLAIVLALFLVPIYIARIFALPPEHAADRTLWTLVILFFSFLGMLVFFLKFEFPQLRDAGNP